MEKVYPTVEELSKIKKNQVCPECSAVFNSESHLNLHLAKTHKKPHLLESKGNREYHCPIESCSYNTSSFFKKFKFLKQHFLNVHAEKSFVCDMCHKGFPTEAACNRHFEYCNIIFKCCDCDVYYSCYETLKTHCRRKKHKILEKNSYRNLELRSPRSEIISTRNRLILPKPSNSTGMIVIDQGCQTEKFNRNSQETQTLLACKWPLFTVETQTIGDYYTKKPEIISLKSAKTQTRLSDPKTAACNTSFSLDDLDINLGGEVERNSSSTQTNLYKDPDMYSIHTDTSDLLNETLDSNIFNCSETQTDFIFNDELFKYCDDYSNMYTQTCEDLLLGEIGLNDNHTQTVFDDVLKSVESQTVMSQIKSNVTHMETQTETHFKKMLEEINA